MSTMNAAIGSSGGGPGPPGGVPPNGGGGDDDQRKRKRSDRPPSCRKHHRSTTVDDSVADESAVENNLAGPSQQEPSYVNDGEDGSSMPSSHRADLDRATQNSIRDSVGAYSIVPGVRTTRRERHDPNISLDYRQQDVTNDPEITYTYNASNLPPNIDIIAEATLVEDHNNTQQNQQPRTSQADDDTDVDTLGMHWYDNVPQLGGAHDDSASVAISVITVPTVLRMMNDDQSQTLTTENECQQSQPQQQHQVSNVDEERGETLATISAPTVQSSIVVHAIPINEGPFAFLETKGGKIATSIAIILILFLAIGLGVGLTAANNGEQPITVIPPEYELLTRTAGNFCVATIPQVFFDRYPSYCTREELKLGGTLQQAIVNAQEKQSQRKVHVSILNGGAVMNEIPANSPVTVGTIYATLPYRDNTISYLELTANDLIKVINNAMEFVTQMVPLDPLYGGGYPYASGLRYDVDLSSAIEKVMNVQVYDQYLEEWIPLDTNEAETNATYTVVTNSYIAEGGDWYLDGVEPLRVEITKIGYTDEVVNYLRNVEGDWMPPTLEEMSTTSFVPII